MKLIIQMPCYNEAQTLEIALNALPRHINGIDLIEYLVINDGSQDNTVEVAKHWGVNYYNNIRTIPETRIHPGHKGLGKSTILFEIYDYRLSGSNFYSRNIGYGNIY